MSKIADRYIRDACDLGVSKNLQRSKVGIMMDLEAAHCNGCILRLDDLLDANDGEFMHDLIGIQTNLNRETGELTNCFVPRFSI